MKSKDWRVGEVNYREEGILFVIQVLVLILFAFILKDILAALIVSFFSRPLTKIAIQWFNKNLEKRKTNHE